MIPVQIKIVDKEKLFIKWDDDSESGISLKYLRDECPCAGCKGETILLKTFRPPSHPIDLPGMYEIKNIETVGEYAIQITWKDGHNTGIYSWDYLKDIEKGQDGNKDQNYKPLL
ncbi:MAG: DUF971 domain-containing protein [Bacteroidetes bacterium]|nr:DUF971 domain-containing protein [Bacteroidota bacterium]